MTTTLAPGRTFLRRARTLRSAGGVAMLAAALASGGCVSWMDSHLDREARTISASYSPSAALRVETENGRITVDRGGQDAVTIVAELRARTVERLAQTRILADMVGDELFVRVEWPDGRRLGNEGCTFEITTPGADGFTLTSSNGRITATGLSGEGRADSSNGAIRIADHAGDAHAETSNGSITLERIAGDASADTSNGRVTVEHVAGALDVSTSNGSVHLRLVDSSTGPFRVRTSNGGVTVVLGDAFSGRIDMETNNGRVQIGGGLRTTTVEMSKESGVIVVGSGAGAESRIRTSNGSIRVSGEDAGADESDDDDPH